MNGPRQSGYPTAVEDMAELADELSELSHHPDEADRPDHYKVERWDGLLLYASSDLSMARAVFAVWKECRPYGRYLLRQNIKVLERWPLDRSIGGE
jgi:hypothetical protein